MLSNKSQNESQARGCIDIAIQRLAEKYPFHVAVLERFDIRCQPEVSTMGVTVVDDDIRLLFNPEFVINTPLDELGGVLLHEVHHIIFGHVLADPTDYSDEWARTVAEEVTVNEFITEPLPEGAIRLQMYPSLRPMKSTVDRYAQLKRRKRRPPIRSLTDPKSNGSVLQAPPGKSSSADAGSNSTVQADSQKQPSANKDGQKNIRSANRAADNAVQQSDMAPAKQPGRGPAKQARTGSANRTDAKTAKRPGAGSANQLETGTTIPSAAGLARQPDAGSAKQSGAKSSMPQPRLSQSEQDDPGIVLDDHSVWQAARQDRRRSEAAVRSVLHDAAIAVGLDRVPEYLLQALTTTAPGLSSGDGVYELTGDVNAHVNWQRLLRRYVGRQFAIRPNLTRPARRFPALVGIVPGRRRRASRPRIMAVIDTSGSITDDLLELISAELSKLARAYDVTVVECDFVIHNVYLYKPIRSVQGRGGTDLRPPFEPDFLRQCRPDLIVYFTDGHGPAPENSPRIPMIWCLTPGGTRPAAWGRIIQM